MRKKIKLVWRWLAVVMLLTFVSTISLNDATAKRPVYYACLENTTGTTAYYKTSWCARTGYNCTAYKIYYIAPGELLRHSIRGRERMYISIYTGGTGGTVLDYYIDGTTGDCNSSSTAVIYYNDRGYLRLY